MFQIVLGVFPLARFLNTSRPFDPLPGTEVECCSTVAKIIEETRHKDVLCHSEGHLMSEFNEKQMKTKQQIHKVLNQILTSEYAPPLQKPLPPLSPSILSVSRINEHYYSTLEMKEEQQWTEETEVEQEGVKSIMISHIIV